MDKDKKNVNRKNSDSSNSIEDLNSKNNNENDYQGENLSNTKPIVSLFL